MVNWNRCLTERDAKKIAPDNELAESLRITSKNKAFSSETLDLNEKTASSKISLSYDSVRELLEAIALSNGFKIYNHVCYTAFLKEIIKDVELAEEFDDLRTIRNDINYYGKDVSIAETKEVLKRLNALKKKLEQK